MSLSLDPDRSQLALLAAIVLLLATLAGCLSLAGEDEAGPEPDLPEEDETSPSGDDGDEEATANASRTASPDPPVGRQWTYEARGAWNDPGEVSVVLARGGGEGLVLAGPTPEDLAEDVLFDRPWHGPVDGDLNPAEGTTFWQPLFDFPLHDGKTWTWDEGETVRARADTVQTPSGPTEGFQMVLEAEEGVVMRWTYAPSVAYLASFTYVFDNTTVLDVELVDVGNSEEALWFEEGPRGATNADPEPDDPGVATLEVPEGYDALVAAAGVKGGGEASLHPPADSGAEAWRYEGGQEEQWVYEPLPAHPGTWTLETHRDPAQAGAEGYVGLSAQVVSWVRPDGSSLEDA